MRIFEGTITSFKELFDEIVYDWHPQAGFNPRPDLNGYTFNKTAMFTEDGEHYMQYKEIVYKITPEVYEKFLVLVQLLNEPNLRTVYMDGVDFQHEAGETDCTIYASKQQVLEQGVCADACGIVKCKLLLEEWVHPQKEDLGANKPKDEQAWLAAYDAKIDSCYKQASRWISLKSTNQIWNTLNEQAIEIYNLRSKLKKLGHE